ncbi:hypothetical protein [Shewanella sp. 10N.286.48.B5]
MDTTNWLGNSVSEGFIHRVSASWLQGCRF